MAQLHIPLHYYDEPPIRAIKFQDGDALLRDYPEYVQLDKSRRLVIACGLEQGCYNYAVEVAEKNNIRVDLGDYDFMMLYCDICFVALCKLFNQPGMPTKRLISQIINGEYKIEDVGAMTAEEYIPELYREHREKYNVISSIVETVKTSELYTCHRCGHNQCVVEKNPCRSGDEQIPLRVTCMFCNNKWSG